MNSDQLLYEINLGDSAAPGHMPAPDRRDLAGRILASPHSFSRAAVAWAAAELTPVATA